MVEGTILMILLFFLSVSGMLSSSYRFAPPTLPFPAALSCDWLLNRTVPMVTVDDDFGLADPIQQYISDNLAFC